MDTSNFGFDPTQFTNAPLQTEGWIRFTDPPDKVFARLAHHEGLTEWVPLLKKVTVTHPQPACERREHRRHNAYAGFSRRIDAGRTRRVLESAVVLRL